MADLEGYAYLVRRCGHTVRIFVIDGVKMKDQILREARHIYEQCKKDKSYPADSTSNAEIENMSNIETIGRCYGGMQFISSVSSRYSKIGMRTPAAHAAHCDGVGSQPYGTNFEVITYDTNMHIFSLAFAHFIGIENFEYWETVFQAEKELLGFNIPTRTTIIGQEKVLIVSTSKYLRMPSCFWTLYMSTKTWAGSWDRERLLDSFFTTVPFMRQRSQWLRDCCKVQSSSARLALIVSEARPIQRVFNVRRWNCYFTGSGKRNNCSTSKHVRCVEPQNMLS